MRWAWLLVVAGGCSSSGGGGYGGTSNSLGSLAGTWDATGTRFGGTPVSATITVGPDQLSVVSDGATYTAVRQGDRFVISYEGSTLHLSQLNPATASLGAIPVNLSGGYRIENTQAPNENCSFDLSPGAAHGSCSDVRGLPRWVDNPSWGTATATHLNGIASSFGDLGGAWQVTLSSGGVCQARFQGSTIFAACQGVDEFNGSFEITFNGNLASGFSSRGLEFSAQRR